MAIALRIARTDAEFEGILALQRRYLRGTLDAAAEDAEGFVFVRHDLPVLRTMADALPQAIAVADERVVGYCLALAPSLADRVPSLAPLFARIADLGLGDRRLFVGGQVCVDRPYRGHRLTTRLYHAIRDALPAPHELCVTEIAGRNHPSLRAHEAIGFRPLTRYPDAGEEWVVVAWELEGNSRGAG